MGEPGEGTSKGYEIGVGDTAGFGVSHLLPPLQSVLQKVIENTEHKAIVLDPETQSKVRGAGRAPQSNASMGVLLWNPPADCAYTLLSCFPPVAPDTPGP